MTQFPTISGHWDDPDLPEKFRSFFLKAYRANVRGQETRPAAAPSVDAATDGGNPPFHLGLDNLPEEHLPPEQFTFLLKVRMDIRRWLATPLQEKDDPLVAGIALTRCCVFTFTLRLVECLLMYLLLDSRFHPDRPIRAKAIGMFTYEGGAAENWRLVLDAMTTSMAGCNLLAGSRTGYALFADEIRLLHLVGDVFFDTLQSLFPIGAVTKCRTAFTLLMKDLGTSRACDHVENYIRRRKTLYREIAAYEANGGRVDTTVVANPDNTESILALAAKIDAQSSDVAECKRAIANMDRRQRTLLAFMKNLITGFVRLFRPGAPTPTRADVEGALLPADRYAALANYTEPRHSQLMSVIDMTDSHPIVRQEGKRGVFTLASAAMAVWEREHRKWAKVPGSFESYEQLKTACYALAEKENINPFCYDQKGQSW